MDLKQIIPSDRSIVVAADVQTMQELAILAEAMAGVPGIGGFKLGFTLGLQDLAAAIYTVKHRMGSSFPVIFDFQKAGNDIPEMGASFAKVVKNSGADAAILFPFAGPATQEAWTKACFNVGLEVITGGIMTHAQFLDSEGGYIANTAPERIYINACTWGCRHFVVPGTKIIWVNRIRTILEEELGEGNFVLYAPGFIAQGGNISECGLAAGKKWHAIVGTAVYGKPLKTMAEMRKSAIDMTSQIVVVPA